MPKGRNTKAREGGGAPWWNSRRTVAYGSPMGKQVLPKGLQPYRKTTPKQMKQIRVKEEWKKRVRKEEWQKETVMPWLQPPSLPTGLSITSCDKKGSGDWQAGRKGVWREAEPGKGRRKVFSLSLNACLPCFLIPKSVTRCFKLS